MIKELTAPVFRTADDGTQELIFSSTAHGITAIDPSSGKIRWEHDGVYNVVLEGQSFQVTLYLYQQDLIWQGIGCRARKSKPTMPGKLA